MTEAQRISRTSARERRKNLAMSLTAVFMALYGATVTADLLLEANLLWLTVLFILATCAAAVAWARLLDEAKLNAHYVAWYWGGSAGLMVSALTFIAMLPALVTPNGLDNLIPIAQPFAMNVSFALGLTLGMIPASIGYLIWWTVLWAQRRG